MLTEKDYEIDLGVFDGYALRAHTDEHGATEAAAFKDGKKCYALTGDVAPAAELGEDLKKIVRAYAAKKGDTYDLDMEIFSVGVHKGDAYTDADLDDMVQNFTALLDANIHKPFLKLAHRNKMHVSDGQPALGWGVSLVKKGKKLFARFSDVPRIVYEAVKKKLYKGVSAEVLWNFRHGGKTYKRVLYAVGLLGADVPAVKGLADLQAFLSQSTGNDPGSFDDMKVCEFAADINGNLITQKGGNMPTPEELQADLAAEKKAREKAEADAKKYKDDLEARNAAETVAQKKTRETEFKQFCEAEVKAGRMTPAGRDILTRDLGVHAYTDDDGFAISVETIKKYMETVGKVLDTSEKGAAKKAGGDKEYSDAGAEVDAKARAYAAEHKADYGAAVTAVLAADEDLAARYSEEYAVGGGD